MVDTTLRNADLAQIADLLANQQAIKHDAVVPAEAIESKQGTLVIDGMGPDGPAGAPGTFKPTAVMDEGVADKLGVPIAYLRKMHTDRPDLYDANVNGWLHGQVRVTAETRGDETVPSKVCHTKAVQTDVPDARRFLVRTFIDPSTGEGIGRALLSDTFKIVDNLDVLMAALEGAKDSGADLKVERCDLSERRMSVSLVAPQLAVNAEELLKGYRNPFDHGAERAGFDRWRRVAEQEGQGYGEGETMPVVWAGFRINNSETGGGAFSVAPELSIRVCKNGLVITGDMLRSIHLGGRMDEGVIRWSDETQQKAMELVALKTRDAVNTFLDVDYVKGIIDRLTEADKPVADPAKAVELVANRLRYSKEQQAGILDHFIRGGQLTAFGVVNAVTSYAQAVESPDEAYDLSNTAMAAFEAALAVA